MAGAPAWEQTAEVIERHPELFAPEVLDSLLSAGTQALENGHRDLAAALLDARFLLDLTASEGVSGALTMLRELETPKRASSSQTVGSLCVTALNGIRNRAAERSLAVLEGAAPGAAAISEAADAWLRLFEHPAFRQISDDLAMGSYRDANPILWIAWAATQEDARLDSLVQCHRTAVGRAPMHSPERGDQLALLGRALQARYGVGGRLDDLDEAIAAYDAALELIHTGSAEPDLIAPRDRINTLHEAANVRRDRYRARGSADDLDVAMSLHKEALGLVSSDDDRLRLILNEIGSDHRLLYQQNGDRSDLEAWVYESIGLGLYRRYGRTGRLDDLNRSVERRVRPSRPRIRSAGLASSAQQPGQCAARSLSGHRALSGP
jgi:hypothetical protein